MSPIVPAPVSPRASMTSTSSGRHGLDARFWASSAPRGRLAHVGADGDVAQRVGVADHPQVRARGPQAGEERGAGCRGGSSCTSASRSRPGAAPPSRPSVRRPAGPRRVDAGGERARLGGRLGHRAVRRRVGARPRRSCSSRCRRPRASTSTTSPGATMPAPAGVPVRITSPGSSVMKRERSATSCGEGEDQVGAVSASWTHLAVDARASSAASPGRCRRRRSAGPIGVKPSWPLASTLEPRSAQRKSWTPDVVGGRVPADVRARPRSGVTLRARRADDDRDLALEGQQLGALRPHDVARRPRARTVGLRKYEGSRRGSGRAAPRDCGS